MRSSRLRRSRTILCGIDFSGSSAVALRYAAALARRRKAPLMALFAVDPLLSAAAASAYDTRGLAGTARRQLLRFVQATLGRRQASRVPCIVVVGKPAPELLSAVEHLRADLIVVGTHGYGGFKKAFFGSTTAAILRRSVVPVLAVPRKCRPPRRGWPSGVTIAPLALDSDTKAQASAALEAAELYGSTLTLVHVVPDVRLPFWLRANEREINRGRAKRAQEWLDKNVPTTRVKPRGTKPETSAVVGDTADAVAAFAAARDARMLILTLPAETAIGRFRQGGTAYRLVCKAQSPVLVLRVGGRSARQRSVRRLRRAA